MDVLTIASGVLTINMDKDFQFEVLLNQNITSIVVQNIATNRGKSCKLFFKQDGTGGRTVAGWPSSVKLAGNAFTATSAAGKRDVISFTALYSEAVLVEDRRSQNAPA